MVFLQGYGVSPAFAARIYKRYGAARHRARAREPVPAGLRRLGDRVPVGRQLAAALGIARDAPARPRPACATCWTSRRATATVRRRGRGCARPRPRCSTCPTTAWSRRPSTGWRDWRRRASTLVRRRRRARRRLRGRPVPGRARAGRAGCARLLAAPARPALAIDRRGARIAWYEREAGIALARQQAEAVTPALSAKVAVITGGPGVGKTTIVRGIVSILGSKGVHVALAAPTGRAAKRLAEATGAARVDAAPPARVAARPRPASRATRPGRSSRRAGRRRGVDARRAPGRRSGRGAAAGDAAGAGRRRRSAAVGRPGDGARRRDRHRGAVPVVRLTEIFRQAAREPDRRQRPPHPRRRAARAGRAPAAAPTSATSSSSRTDDPRPRPRGDSRPGGDAAAHAATACSPHDVQVLSPMHRGELGAGNLNQLLQAALTAGAPERSNAATARCASATR